MAALTFTLGLLGCLTTSLSAMLLSTVAPRPPARAVDEGLEELRERLADESPGTRRSAVREAARRGGREAWGLVLEALSDAEAEVADAAQLAFGELEDPGFVDELFGHGGLRSQEETVRWRAAEALGRVRAEVDARSLAERLELNDQRAVRLLVWSVERLARAARVRGDRERLIRALVRVHQSKRDEALAADALLALAALEAPELPRLATNARTSSAPELRSAALSVALLAPLPEREAWARALAADRESAVRIQAIECLERIGTRSAAAVLVARLELEDRAGVRWRVLAALQSVSGLKHRFDPRPWQHWLEACPENWLASPRSGGGDPDPGATQAAGLATLEVRGERVCFLFDFSGSMWEELPDGRTPKDVVDGELRTALEGLPESTEFNLIPYSYHPQPWQDGVAPARKRNVLAALDFFEECRLRGRGNVWEALLLALADPAVDTIVVLTDGYPTGGLHADMDLIGPLFEHANRYRKVTLDAVLVDAQYQGVRQWSGLAASSGGTCTQVALRR